MSESNFLQTGPAEHVYKPTISGIDGEVLISMPNDQYVRMSADMARKFAGQILSAAAQADGEVARSFIFDIPR